MATNDRIGDQFASMLATFNKQQKVYVEFLRADLSDSKPTPAEM